MNEDVKNFYDICIDRVCDWLEEEEEISVEFISEPGNFYYYEDGIMVMTEEYHKTRGYCCKNGCRHCPYGYKDVKKDE